MKQLRRLLLCIMLLPLFSACATMLPHMEAPEINVIDITPLPAEGLLEQRIQVDLRIINPNNIDLAMTGMSFQLDLNEARLARGVSHQAIQIPRLGEAKTSVIISTTITDIFRQAMILSEKSGLKYHISGTVYLDGLMRSITFTHQGDLINEHPAR
ncbi:LEA type 2 family protein [Mariprofundus erugo]|uniref:LEA type 2 family protein n=1 Tax=Mariprofundus erugo TaxID=2528639 RepID=UPI0010FDF234|nr:LEA type 2 family protein [Mariprofundus erugo]TLS73539.1 LEA type 2 family protein [Mariprofundus erugo]